MNPTPLSRRFGHKLREIRTAQGISQYDFAQLTRLEQAQISRLEGGRRLPEYKTLRALARLLSKEQLHELVNV